MAKYIRRLNNPKSKVGNEGKIAMGRSHLNFGNIYKAEKYAKEALEIHPTLDCYLLLMDVYKKMGDLVAFKAASKKALELIPLFCVTERAELEKKIKDSSQTLMEKYNEEKILSYFEKIRTSAKNIVEMNSEESLDNVLREEGMLFIAGKTYRYTDIKAYKKEDWQGGHRPADYPQDEEYWVDRITEIGIKDNSIEKIEYWGEVYSSAYRPKLWIYTETDTIIVPYFTKNDQGNSIGMSNEDISALSTTLSRILNSEKSVTFK